MGQDHGPHSRCQTQRYPKQEPKAHLPTAGDLISHGKFLLLVFVLPELTGEQERSMPFTGAHDLYTHVKLTGSALDTKGVYVGIFISSSHLIVRQCIRHIAPWVGTVAERDVNRTWSCH